MTDAKYQQIKDALLAQRKKVTSSKRAAARFLREAGVMHLLVDSPDEKNKISTPVTRKPGNTSK